MAKKESKKTEAEEVKALALSQAAPENEPVPEAETEYPIKAAGEVIVMDEEFPLRGRITELEIALHKANQEIADLKATHEDVDGTIANLNGQIAALERQLKDATQRALSIQEDAMRKNPDQPPLTVELFEVVDTRKDLDATILDSAGTPFVPTKDEFGFAHYFVPHGYAGSLILGSSGRYVYVGKENEITVIQLEGLYRVPHKVQRHVLTRDGRKGDYWHTQGE